MAEVYGGDFLSYVSELERRDADVAARLDAAVCLLRRVDEVRARADRVRTSLAALPREIEQAEQAEQDARAREAAARREHSEAETRLADAGRSRRTGQEARAAAERAVRRAEVVVTDAQATVARTSERLRALEGDGSALRAEGEGLVVEAREVARDVSALPCLSDSGRTVPGASLQAIEEWGARAHAALFVVNGSLENERDRVVLEANALAAAALGEQVAGASVALVRRRLEESLPVQG